MIDTFCFSIGKFVIILSFTNTLFGSSHHGATYEIIVFTNFSGVIELKNILITKKRKLTPPQYRNDRASVLLCSEVGEIAVRAQQCLELQGIK